jgi:hypothetical protein
MRYGPVALVVSGEIGRNVSTLKSDFDAVIDHRDDRGLDHAYPVDTQAYHW